MSRWYFPVLVHFILIFPFFYRYYRRYGLLLILLTCIISYSVRCIVQCRSGSGFPCQQIADLSGVRYIQMRYIADSIFGRIDSFLAGMIAYDLFIYISEQYNISETKQEEKNHKQQQYSLIHPLFNRHTMTLFIVGILWHSVINYI